MNQNQKNPDASAQEEAHYTGLLVIVGFLAMVVAVLQYCAARSAADAANRSADAAADSAKISRIALHADRPLVIVQTVGVSLNMDQARMTPRVIFRNYGQNPAIILEAYLGFTTCPKDEIGQLNKDTVTSWPYARHSIQTQVLAAGETANEPITIKWFMPARFKEILDKKVVPVAHGLVRYRGAFDLIEPYESLFCWFYVTGDPMFPDGYFVIGPKELNTTT